jgi:hypothetical protein
MAVSGDENAKELAKREKRLFDKKANLDQLNQELAYNFYPWRADFTVERCLGEEYAADIFDSAPVLARRDLANARASMLRPRGQQWFKATLLNKLLAESAPIARHLDWVNDRARTVLYQRRSGFVRAMKEADNDLVTFGNAVGSCEASRDEEGALRPLFRTWHLRDCVWLDDENGVTQDFLARRFKCSARHIKKRFPDATLHGEIEDALDEDPDKEFRLCHVVMLADEYDYYKNQGGNGKWASIYYDSQHQTILRERGRPSFPYRVARWETMSEVQYAISPAALTSVSDARGMQVLARVLMEAGEKALDPPVKATQGAIVGEVNNYGGGVTWVKADYDEKLGPAIELLAPRTNPPSGIEMKQMALQAMRDEWYLTKLTLPQQAKTAYETAQLVEEFVRANIPLFEPWEADTEATLDRAFEVMLEIGSFGPMNEWPPQLSGRTLSFEFSNPLQDAVEKAKVAQATTALGLIAGGHQADPQMQPVADMEQMIQDAIRGSGAPNRWLTDLNEARRQKAEAQAQATEQGNILGALDQAQSAADVVNKGADGLAKLQTAFAQPAADQSFAYGPT